MLSISACLSSLTLCTCTIFQPKTMLCSYLYDVLTTIKKHRNRPTSTQLVGLLVGRIEKAFYDGCIDLHLYNIMLVSVQKQHWTYYIFVGARLNFSWILVESESCLIKRTYSNFCPSVGFLTLHPSIEFTMHAEIHERMTFSKTSTSAVRCTS